MMALPTREKTEADSAVQDNHQNSEHCIAPECQNGLTTKRHCADQYNLYDHDGEREDKRSERFGKELGKMICFADDPKCAP